MKTPKFKSVVYEGVRINTFACKKGEGLEKHEHTFDHLTVCISGEILISKEGKQRTITPDDGPINLVANEWHEITATKSGTVFTNIFKEAECQTLPQSV